MVPFGRRRLLHHGAIDLAGLRLDGGDGGHVDDATGGHGRRQDVRGLCRADQNRADGKRIGQIFANWKAMLAASRFGMTSTFASPRRRDAG